MVTDFFAAEYPAPDITVQGTFAFLQGIDAITLIPLTNQTQGVRTVAPPLVPPPRGLANESLPVK